jgi:hypothetical protein
MADEFDRASARLKAASPAPESDPVVRHSDWNRWRWRAVAAFVALALAQAIGFYWLSSEADNRQREDTTNLQQDRAAIANGLRSDCLDQADSRQALRSALKGMTQITRLSVASGDESVVQGARIIAIVDAELARIPTITRAECERLARIIHPGGP